MERVLSSPSSVKVTVPPVRERDPGEPKTEPVRPQWTTRRAWLRRNLNHKLRIITIAGSSMRPLS